MKSVRVSAFWWSPARQPEEVLRQLWGFGRQWLWASRFGGVPFRNFGDMLSPVILSFAMPKLRSIEWASPSNASIFGLGSILDQWVRNGMQAEIWGSGFSRIRGRSLLLDDGSPAREKILAVRGCLTRDALGLPIDTTLGDPAILFHEIMAEDVARVSTRRHGLVVVPHYFDFCTRDNRFLLRDMEGHGFDVVSPLRPWRTVVDKINHAELVLTSSLHGKIVADALGVPAIVLRFPTSDCIDKFDDYVSLWGTELKTIRSDDALLIPRNTGLLHAACADVETISTMIDNRCLLLKRSLESASCFRGDIHVE